MIEYGFVIEKEPNYNLYLLIPDDGNQLTMSQNEHFLHALGFQSLREGQKVRLRVVVEDDKP